MPARALPSAGRLSAPLATFALRVAGVFLGLLALMRLPFIEKGLILPFAELQRSLACAAIGAPADAIVVGRSCTGADALALTLAVVLAYPAAPRRRCAGVAAALALITGINMARLGSLSLVAGQPALFDVLHVTVWPLVVVVTVAGWLFAWMGGSAVAPGIVSPVAGWMERRTAGRVAAWVGAALVLYLLAAPWLAQAGVVVGAARLAAGAAAGVLGVFGVPARANAAALVVPGGAWLITAECVLTPLIALYLGLAAALLPWRRALLAAVLAVPLFATLAVARLLMLAWPSWLGSATVAVHAFHQLAVAVALVAVVIWMKRRRASEGPGGTAAAAAAAIGLGLAAAVAIGLSDRWLVRPLWDAAADRLHLGHLLEDSQGALALLPAFQGGLWVALWTTLGRGRSARRAALGLVMMVLAGLAVRAGWGELLRHGGIAAPILLVRAGAIAVPVALLGLLARLPRPLVAAPAPNAATRSVATAGWI